MDKIFNKEEFQRLLFLVFLGEWVMNAHKGPDSNAEYTNVLDKVLGHAQITSVPVLPVPRMKI